MQVTAKYRLDGSSNIEDDGSMKQQNFWFGIDLVDDMIISEWCQNVIVSNR